MYFAVANDHIDLSVEQWGNKPGNIFAFILIVGCRVDDDIGT